MCISVALEMIERVRVSAWERYVLDREKKSGKKSTFYLWWKMCPFTHTDEYDAYVVCGCNNKCWRGKMKLCVQMTSDDEEERFSEWCEGSIWWNGKSELKMNNTQENRNKVGTDEHAHESEREWEEGRERERKEWPHKNASIWQITAIPSYIWMMSACVLDARASFFSRQSWTIRLVSCIDRYKRGDICIHTSLAYHTCNNNVNWSTLN